MKYLFIHFAFLFICVFLFFPHSTSAQIVLDSDSINSRLNLDIEPEFPKSNQTVKLTISNFFFDLSRSTITWTVNGKKVKEGKDVRSIEINTGPLGTRTKIEISVVPPDNGVPFTNTHFIYPGEVSIITQAKTFTPPLYKGIAHFAHQGEVRIAALPQFVSEGGNLIPAENLIYTWTHGKKVLEDSSGYGKSFVDIQGGFFSRPEVVKLRVSTVDNLQESETFIVIEPKKPTLLFYENSPLYGVLYNKAITDEFTLKEKEVSFTGVPYSMTRTNNNAMMFKWTINGVAAGSGAGGDTVTVRDEANKGGQSLIKLSVTNSEKEFQEAFGSFYINLLKP